MRGSGIAIQMLAALLLLSGVATAGYALVQPPGQETTYTLTVEEVDDNAPGSDSAGVAYADLSQEGRVAFGHAKLDGSYEFDGEPPKQLQSNAYVVTDGATYAVTITQQERITERLATLFAGTTTSFIGAFVFVSWLDVL